MRIIVIVACVAIVLAGALFGAGLYFSAPVFDERVSEPPDGAFDILPVSEALTFARTKDGRLLLVRSADADAIEAVDLGAALDTVATDPLAILRTHGYQRVAARLTGVAQAVPLEQLGMPFDPGYPHIAAGTNFRAHAEEVGLDEGPFLFPKLTRATAWDARVPARTRLDYEVELCAVALPTPRAGRACCPSGHSCWCPVAMRTFTGAWKSASRSTIVCGSATPRA
jgi:hypothetical protein